jgi:hypothetical protein
MEGSSPSRLLAIIIVLAYIIGAGLIAGMVSALKVLAAMLLPLACIWFPEAMGDYTQGHVNKQSSPAFVWFLGWTLLFLPAIVATILLLQGVPLGSL